MLRAPPILIGVIADRNTAIPDGTGNFAGFRPTDPYSPVAISGDNVVFYGVGDSGQEGLYLSRPSSSLLKVADRSTAIPAGTGYFTSFVPPNPTLPPSPIIGGETVAFIGFGSGGQTGIYRFLPPTPIMPEGLFTALANTNTLIPGDGRTFEFFQSVSMDGTNVAFVGGKSGIVTSDGGYSWQLGV